ALLFIRLHGRQYRYAVVVDRPGSGEIIAGDQEVDNISERGLEGLTQFLTFRTTLEQAPPVGIDLTKDELSFYPIIYWPVSATEPMPSTAAISRID
ncbi:DUF4159 domain-containing protein, partial [Rhizobium ruizarguesonis]